MSAARFKPVADGQVAAVIALWRACGLTRPWNNPESDIALARASADADVLVHEAGGEVLAALMVGHDGHRGAVYYLGVHPQRRMAGLGRAAMAAAEGWLTARGVPKLNLMIRAGNEPVQRFYEKLGYEQEPRIVMGRRLNPR